MSSRVSKWRHRNSALNQLLDREFENEENLQMQCSNSSFENEEIVDCDMNQSNSRILEDTTNSDSDSESDNDMNDITVDNEGNLVDNIAHWAIQHNITHNALNSLMNILKKHVSTELPADARTVLKTPRHVSVDKKCGGEYVYIGITAAVNKQPSELLCSSKIYLTVNIDGLPLFKSSDTQVWPILGKLNEGKPFIIALFCGSKKPTSVPEYMEDFLKELSVLTENGIIIGKERKDFELKYFTCDAPARQFLKCIKGHTGYYACERCTVEGEMYDRVMTFKDTSCPLRTDLEFDTYQYSRHQHQRSILCSYNIPCVSIFVLDFMHLVCLGVVKRMLYFLKEGSRFCKLSHGQLDLISSRLIDLRNSLPSEFARQPRSLQHFKRWKATEFKQFLLYTGMFVSKDIVSKPVYEHFVSLCVSISVMLYYKPGDQNYLEIFDYIKSLLKWYVDKSPELYGDSFVSNNVHSLIHLHQDLESMHSGLQELSAFPFENFMQVIKKMVRKSHQPLSQITKRLTEMEFTENCIPYKAIKWKISDVGNRDSWFLLHNNKIFKVREVKRNKQLVGDLVSIDKTFPYFAKPIDSKLLNICFAPKALRFVSGTINESDIANKFVAIFNMEGVLLIPMLHNL